VADIFFGYSATFLQISMAFILTLIYVRKKSTIVGITSQGTFLGCIYFYSWWKGGESVFQNMAFFFAALIVLLFLLNFGMNLRTPSFLPLIILLFLLPYAASFGTGNSLFIQIIIFYSRVFPSPF
jgi:hypothetical protein